MITSTKSDSAKTSTNAGAPATARPVVPSLKPRHLAIYNNCVQHAEDTEEFWQRVHDFIDLPYNNGDHDILGIYNALEVEIYGKDKDSDYQCNIDD